MLWHFQFHDAIISQPTHVGLLHDAGTYEMSLGFHKVMETRGWLKLLARPSFGVQKAVEQGRQ